MVQKTASLVLFGVVACGEAAFVHNMTPMNVPQHVQNGSSSSTLKMYVPGSSQERTVNKSSKTSLTAMIRDSGSSSTVESDTLPEFKTVHGMLSPRTVYLLEESYEAGSGCEEVGHFLKTYKQKGPMSCIQYLSDPVVLPALTKAMRDSVL